MLRGLDGLVAAASLALSTGAVSCAAACAVLCGAAPFAVAAFSGPADTSKDDSELGESIGLWTNGSATGPVEGSSGSLGGGATASSDSSSDADDVEGDASTAAGTCAVAGEAAVLTDMAAAGVAREGGPACGATAGTPCAAAEPDLLSWTCPDIWFMSCTTTSGVCSGAWGLTATAARCVLGSKGGAAAGALAESKGELVASGTLTVCGAPAAASKGEARS